MTALQSLAEIEDERATEVLRARRERWRSFMESCINSPPMLAELRSGLLAMGLMHAEVDLMMSRGPFLVTLSDIELDQ